VTMSASLRQEMRRLFHWLLCGSAAQKFPALALFPELGHCYVWVRCTRCGYMREVLAMKIREAAEKEKCE